MAEWQGIELGTPGASARREWERRRARRRGQDGDRGRIARFVRPSRAPRSESAWATGAAGEEALARLLAKRCPSVVVLHDRALPGTRANLDHVAVTPTGVVVIDAKRYRGRVEVRRRAGERRLFVAGRDRTKLLDGLERQRLAVREIVDALVPELPVEACLCFLSPEGARNPLPLLGALEVRGFELLRPRRLARRLNASGPLSADSRREVAALLAAELPCA